MKQAFMSGGLDPIPDHFFHGEDLSPKDAERKLLDACDSHEEDYYYRELDEDEITARKNEMTTLDIRFEDLAEEKAKKVGEFKRQMDPIAQRKKLILGEVRAGKVREEGEVYTVLFPEHRRAAVYDRSGRKLSERNMTPEERQQNIRFDVGYGSGTGTDG